MRPDGVTRTGVVQPVQGYNPTQDVMNVAAEFTNVYGPQMTTPLAGLGYGQLLGPNLGLFARARLKVAAWAARKRANKFIAAGGMHGLGGAQLLGITPNGSKVQMGPQINPMPSRRAEMLSRIAQANFPDGWGSNAMDMIADRWNGKRGRWGA